MADDMGIPYKQPDEQTLLHATIDVLTKLRVDDAVEAVARAAEINPDELKLHIAWQLIALNHELRKKLHDPKKDENSAALAKVPAKKKLHGLKEDSKTVPSCPKCGGARRTVWPEAGLMQDCDACSSETPASSVAQEPVAATAEPCMSDLDALLERYAAPDATDVALESAQGRALTDLAEQLVGKDKTVVWRKNTSNDVVFRQVLRTWVECRWYPKSRSELKVSMMSREHLLNILRRIDNWGVPRIRLRAVINEMRRRLSYSSR